MREVWKGLIVGSLVGASVGLLLEYLEAMSRGAAQVAQGASAHVPSVAANAADLASGVAQKLRDSDLPERAGEVAKGMGEQLKDAVDAGRTTLRIDSPKPARRAVPLRLVMLAGGDLVGLVD